MSSWRNSSHYFRQVNLTNKTAEPQSELKQDIDVKKKIIDKSKLTKAELKTAKALASNKELKQDIKIKQAIINREKVPSKKFPPTVAVPLPPDRKELKEIYEPVAVTNKHVTNADVDLILS